MSKIAIRMPKMSWSSHRSVLQMTSGDAKRPGSTYVQLFLRWYQGGLKAVYFLVFWKWKSSPSLHVMHPLSASHRDKAKHWEPQGKTASIWNCWGLLVVCFAFCWFFMIDLLTTTSSWYLFWLCVCFALLMYVNSMGLFMLWQIKRKQVQ